MTFILFALPFVAAITLFTYPAFVELYKTGVSGMTGTSDEDDFKEIYGMETYKVPDANDPNVKGGIINGVWYWSYDLSDYAKKLHKFIYNN